MPYIKRDTLTELFELCGIDSPASLVAAAGVDINTARNIFKRMGTEDFIRVNRTTLEKLCDALVAYPDELTGEEVMRELRANKKFRGKLDELDADHLVCVTLTFRTPCGRIDLVHRLAADFIRCAGVKRYIAYINMSQPLVRIITDAELDGEAARERWLYGDVELLPVSLHLAREVLRGIASDEALRDTVWFSRG